MKARISKAGSPRLRSFEEPERRGLEETLDRERLRVVNKHLPLGMIMARCAGRGRVVVTGSQRLDRPPPSGLERHSPADGCARGVFAVASGYPPAARSR